MNVRVDKRFELVVERLGKNSHLMLSEQYNLVFFFLLYGILVLCVC